MLSPATAMQPYCRADQVEIQRIRKNMDGRRRRRSTYSCLLTVSTLAFSMTSATAFQGDLPLHLSRLNLHRGQRFQHAPTFQRVVTDPDHLLSMEINKKSLEALEDMYMLNTQADGLSGDLIEMPPGFDKSSIENIRKEKLDKKQYMMKKVSTSSRLGRSKGSTSVSSGSTKKLTPVNSNITERRSSAAPRTPPRGDAVPARSSKVGERSTNTRQRKSRSSTMPGFMDRGNTGRHQAFRDGIKMVETRTGKKLTKLIDTPDAKKRRRQINGEAMYRASASVPESMIQFANEIHDVERITPAEETELGIKTQEAIRLQKLYDNLEEKLNRPPTDGEWCAAAGKINMEAIIETIEEGLEAKNKLVTSNLRMVQGVVNVYIRNGLGGQYNAGDLMQEGVMALIRAAEKFDPTRGFRFSTYAMYWIRSSVKRSQILQSRVVTVPQRLYENHKRILRVEKELRVSLDRAPTKAEIGEAVGMSEAQIDRCLKAMSQRCYSLDQQVKNNKKPMSGDSNEDTMYELVESKTDDGEYNKLKHVFFREDLIKTINRHLTEEEANLLLLRYGLADPSKIRSIKASGPLTIAEVSRMVGLKPDKVRRMINKSLKHLKAIIGNEWIDYERDLQ